MMTDGDIGAGQVRSSHPLGRAFAALRHHRVRSVGHLLTGTSATVCLSLL
jgi:hypothetical protein